ncbi:hypothetical protein COO17_07960 [Bacillus wiedmannii]|uniref:Uncharacterized protein n=1 Tax=Bacillus wiedmannii TaxID=1890302 RepID=A0A2A7BV73_9BACI|nr:hypothetical protein COO17_07960 [Bacillus wiedmannii]PFZ98886.1 hypothetical protein COL83_04590 [Bacillus wiedmannii]
MIGAATVFGRRTFTTSVTAETIVIADVLNVREKPTTESKVWVENYGEAIAGDTGSTIKGNRINVLVGSKSKAINWRRQTVKVKILLYSW